MSREPARRRLEVFAQQFFPGSRIEETGFFEFVLDKPYRVSWPGWPSNLGGIVLTTDYRQSCEMIRAAYSRSCWRYFEASL